MFSRASLRKPSHFIIQTRNKHYSKTSILGKTQSLGGCRSIGDNESANPLKFYLGSVSSGILILGSSLGYCWWSSSSSSSLGSNSHFSFADRGRETWPAGDDFEEPNISKKRKFLFGDTYRRKVFFNYEKRIRMQSPPEKVFEYFASVRSPSGEVLMTPADLMRAVVPVFPPSDSSRVREGFLRGERVPGDLCCPPSKFFMLFDTNGDGLISFAEYIFFVTLLSIPESSFAVAFKMFDLDNNGEIDREEFKKVMALMRAQNRQGAHHNDGKRQGLNVSEPVENGGLLEYFFGKDGQQKLKHGRFVKFLRELHKEILRLEFSHYDYKGLGSISAKDFALSIVASADLSHISKLLDLVDKLEKDPLLKDQRITFEEFKNFAELRRKLQSFSLAIFSFGKVNGLLTKKDFQRAASQVCGVTITDHVVDIIFHLFDANQDGSLSSKEFVRVVQKREVDGVQVREAGIRGLFSCYKNCATRCSSKLML